MISPSIRALRLEVKLKLVPLEREAQIVLQQPEVAQLAVHFRFEEAGPAPALPLGAIERRIGVRKQRRRIDAIVRIDGDADTEADMGEIIVDLELVADRLDQTLGEREYVFPSDVVGHQDHELVAANAGDESTIGLSDKTFGGRPHHHVADGMTEQIVDVLEAVEIQAEHSEAGRGFLSLLEPLVQCGIESVAVGQIGQHIVMREMADPLLRVDAFGDVLDHADQILRLTCAVRDQHLARIDDAVVTLDADLEQVLLQDQRRAAGDDPTILLVDHAGDIGRENLLGRPAQHLLARHAVIVLAGAIEQNIARIFRTFREHRDRYVLDDGVEEFLGPQQILLDLIRRVPTHVRRSLTVAVASLIGRADELAELDEIDLSGGISGAAELFGEQAMHHPIARRRVRASCPQMSSICIPVLSQLS
jgi:hypothetical protein